ncbi:hypothetical protein C0J52_18632 [Blattella germanica]|nr:hypothetical protein C0J52_18632 [Blattella germanica]
MLGYKMYGCVFSMLFIAIVCFVIAQAETSLQETTDDFDPRIVGGYDAHPGELPFQVSIQRKYYFGNGSFHYCGGSIIDKHHILTAAHCVNGIPLPEFRIFAGVLNKTWQAEEETKVVRDVSNIYKHPDFDYDTYFNDIAIIRVSEVFPNDNPNVAPISLREEAATEGMNCTASGWGYLANGTLPSALQLVVLPFISHNTCRGIYGEEVLLPGMCCAGFEEGGKDACGGDSGGPLQCGGVLTGVVSAGADCAAPNQPGVYADVVFYKDWIAQTLKESEANSTSSNGNLGDSGGPLQCDKKLVGIVSWGFGCALAGNPGVYTDVQFYYNWILSNMQAP